MKEQDFYKSRLAEPLISSDDTGGRIRSFSMSRGSGEPDPRQVRHEYELGQQSSSKVESSEDSSGQDLPDSIDKLLARKLAEQGGVIKWESETDVLFDSMANADGK